jgi:uncharacterized protein YpuA (DUF1002 family)
VDHADAVWNRAAVDGGGPRPLHGDAALTAVLRLHNLAMNSGLLDAIERLTGPELDAAERGYTWLGHPDAAQVIAYVRDQVHSGALDSDDRADRLEQEADQRYADVIPGDATLHSAFRHRIAEEPSAFADTRE